MAAHTLPKLFLELPGDECKTPRDGLRPCKTEDMLFLATLLQRAGDTRYFLEVRGGALIPETVAADNPLSRVHPRFKARISRATIRGWFRHRYFGIRQAFADAIPLPFVIEPEGRELRKPRNWEPVHPWMAGKGLKWPFEKARDPLLTNLHKTPLLSWQDHRPLRKWEVYCPLNGPVIPIRHEWNSPPWAWQHLCGRHWRALLCPHCLGQFHIQLIAMN